MTDTLNTPPAPTPYLGGHLLLAMPAIGDPRFHRAVIFICAHDANGAMGLKLTEAQPGTDLAKLMTELKISHDGTAAAAVPVLHGGPVETGRGFVLHSADFQQKETVVVNDTFGVTATLNVLQAIAEHKGPAQIVFALGYAGWQAGQLEQELSDNAWLVMPATADLIFNVPADEKWETAMAQLGITPAQMPLSGGRA